MTIENYKPSAIPVVNQPNQPIALYLKDQLAKISNAIGSLITQLLPFGASGPNHSSGLVPDPGAVAGTTHFLREDGTWAVPPSPGVFGASGPSHSSGIVPDPGSTAGTLRFLREDATFAIPAVNPFDVTKAGIVGDGVTVNSATTINSLWATNVLLYFPEGTYIINGTISGPATQGAGIIGDGSALSILSFQNTTGDCVVSHDLVFGPRFIGLKITRGSLATTGYGLNMNPTSTNDWALVQDIWLLNHSIGLNLGSTGYSRAQYIRSESNRNFGFQIFGQWQLLDLYAANNGSHGFYIGGNTAPASSGQWRGLATFQNAGYGFIVDGQATGRRIEGIRLSDSFFGNDSLGEMFIDSYGTAPHTFTDVYCELQPANKDGITVTANNADVSFNSCHSEGSGTARALSWAGTGTLLVNGGSYITTGSGTGIGATAGKASIIGAIGRSSTNYGIATVSPMTASSVIACNASGSPSGVLNTATTANSQYNY